MKLMADTAQERMKDWSPEKNVEGLIEAIVKAVRFRDDYKIARTEAMP